MAQYQETKEIGTSADTKGVYDDAFSKSVTPPSMMRMSGPQSIGDVPQLVPQTRLSSSQQKAAVHRGITVSFSENSKGWVSFKTIDPEVGLSLNNEYYTAKGGVLWKHHDDSVDRNSFYNTLGGINSQSSITVLFNDLPSVIKSFTTLNYEGSQSRIVPNITDNKYYNNQNPNDPTTWVLGWYVNSVITDQQTGRIPGMIEGGEWKGEFINKEGKWFNYIIGEETVWKNGVPVDGGSPAPIFGASGNLDTKEFSTQGIGVVTIPPLVQL
jgi:hypothetical protein